MDSNLNNQIENEFNCNQELIIDSNNKFNSELESKWKEIEERTQEKLKKSKEAQRINDLNDFSIMRINLKSLIHTLDEFSDFEDFCKNKINQLEKIKQSIEKSSNYSQNLITFGFNKSENINTNNNDLKTFLKIDNVNEKKTSKNGKFTIKDLIGMNKNTNIKKKFDFKNLFEIIDNNNDDINRSSIVNNVNNFENIDVLRNNSGNGLIREVNEELKIKRPTYLDENNIGINNKNNKYINYCQKNKNIYIKFFENNSFINNYYRTNRNIDSRNKIRTKSKIEENYNYLYRLYLNLKKK